MEISLHNSTDRTTATDLYKLFKEMHGCDMGDMKKEEDRKDDDNLYPINFPAVGDKIKRPGKLVVGETSDADKASGIPSTASVEIEETVTPAILTAIREEIRDRVSHLFAGTFILAMERQRPGKMAVVGDYDPVPFEVPKFIDKDDLARVLYNAEKLMDPQDPDFNKAVADRGVGALRILADVVNFAVAHRDPHAALKWLEKMSADWRDEKRGTISVASLSWMREASEQKEGEKPELGRSDVLAKRFRGMQKMDYNLKNPRLIEQASIKFNGRRRNLIQGVVGIYNFAVWKCDVQDFYKAEWLYILSQFIVNVPDKEVYEKPFCDALKTLADKMVAAEKPDQISNAINEFIKETLPRILLEEEKKAKASASAPAANTTPAPGGNPAPDIIYLSADGSGEKS